MTELDEIRNRRMGEVKRRLSYPKEPIELTSANFPENLQKYPLLAVDCWAEWCFPCKMIEPVIEELAAEYSGRVVFGKLNIDGNREFAMELGIQSIPTLIVFKDGKLVDRIIGAAPKEKIEDMLNGIL